MRIALASIHPRPLSGQIEGLVGLAQALHQQGHMVNVVSPFPSQQLLTANRFRLSSHPRRVILDQPLRISRVLSELVRLSPRVDVIHLNLPTPSFSILGDLLQTMVKVPVIIGFEAHLVSVRDLVRRERLAQSFRFYLPRLLINNRLLARMTLHHAARYVVSTAFQKAELVSLGASPDRIRLLPPVLPLDKLARPPRDGQRSRFPPGRLVTYIGHYNPVKGVDVLVRAFQMLAPCYPDLRLALAWSGIGEKPYVEALLRGGWSEGRVLQLGQVDVPDLLAASDVVALPYRMTIGQAAYPAVLLEALAANVPVVTTDLPLLRELTDGGTSALLVPPDDPAALAMGIERILNEPIFTRQLLEAQRQQAQRFQPQCAAREYEQLYEQVIAGQAAVLCPAGNREDL